MGRWMLVGLLAFAVALAGPAYAEVQNIKVSGDIDLKVIAHRDYDLMKTRGNISGAPGGITPDVTRNDNEDFFLSTVRVRVDADLTDNVLAAVRLLNQRKWDVDDASTGDIELDNAYVVLKEFLYSPLTVIAGRQDLKYGTGFIVGPGLLRDPNTTFPDAADSAGNQFNGREHSAFNAYDAIRAILDYAPLTIEAVYSKIDEAATAAAASKSDDTDLYGLVVNYKLNQWGAEVEPYYFYKQDAQASLVASDNSANRTYENVRTHTAGLRLAGSPIENLSLSGEGAHQWGEIQDDTPFQERKRDAWGAQVKASYNWVNVPWTPATGIGWVFFTGEDPSPAGDGLDQVDEYNAWDTMFRGEFYTFIQDFLAGNDGGGLYDTVDANDTSAGTNRMLLYGDVTLKPLEDVTLWARYIHAWFEEDPRTGRSSEAGGEVDFKALYDYTEDVQLGLFGGWFFPGDYYDDAAVAANDRSDDMAWTFGGAAVVKF